MPRVSRLVTRSMDLSSVPTISTFWTGIRDRRDPRPAALAGTRHPRRATSGSRASGPVRGVLREMFMNEANHRDRTPAT